MKIKIRPFTNLLLVTLLASAATSFGADPVPTPAVPAVPAPKVVSAAKKELNALVAKISAKMRAGSKVEADFADELKEFDALIASHKGETDDDVVQIHMMKAMLYTQVFKDTKKGDELKNQLIKDFPDSAAAKNIAAQEAAEKIRKSLVVGTKFPDFDEKDIDGMPLSIALYKGKIVLVDFWATWCGPCIAELPNVLATYEKHHKDGFEIIGISFDQATAEQKLRDFIKTKNMPWQQFFDGKYWQSKLGVKYGVNSIPATYLLDGDGVIIGKDLRGPDLEKAVAAAVAKLKK